MAKDDEKAGDPTSPVLRHAGKQNVDRWGARLVEESEKYRQQAMGKKPTRENTPQEKKKDPPGGYDDTPIPNAPPGYTLKFTFHRAENLPFADFGTFSSDPYIIAVLKTDLPQRHKSDPDLKIRTPTIHRNVNPVWNTEWIVANVPATGFALKCRLYDEDPADHDDRLGNVHVHMDSIDDSWTGIKERVFKIKKRVGSKRAYLFRACAALVSRDVEMSGDVIISVENLGRTKDENGGRAYTVGPLPWCRHYSPLIGRLTGVKDREQSQDGKPDVEKYNFQAIQMQLPGPVPAELYHRYVEFKPFVAGMFTDHSLRGRILNRALHHQHARVYNFDRSTKYGVFDYPSTQMTKQFLDFVQYDHGGRIFTYVLTLDGQFRFTETGKEFGIDLLSKHTMHSDVSIYIAFSGEFFIRRLKHPYKDKNKSPDPSREALPPAEEEGDNNRPKSSSSNSNPDHYELVIDNDSGTYRPNPKLLPILRDYLTHAFPGLKVATLDCTADQEKMSKLKNEQREKKKKSGHMITYMQNSSMDSLSSSDVEDLDDRAAGREHESRYKHQLHKYMGYGEDTFHGSPDRPMVNGGSSQAVNEKTNGNTAPGGKEFSEKESHNPNINGDLRPQQQMAQV
jgi:hypothetical protein